MDKKTITKVKSVLFKLGLVAISIGIAYWYGTFHPNNHTLVNISKQFDDDNLRALKEIGFKEPDFIYNDRKSFIVAVSKCMDYINFTLEKEKRIPRSMVVAMAIIESADGTSRFAVEGNNLFGIRTWNDNIPQLKPRGIPNAKFGVKKFDSKCESVGEVISILNRHPAYEKFRTARTNKKDVNSMIDGITAWSTNDQYIIIIKQTILDNKLL